MANIQHANLPEDKLHEVKGASTASADTWLKAVGDGTTTFDNLPTHTFVVLDTLSDASTNDQTLSAIDTELQIDFSGTSFSSAGGSMSIETDGTVTFNEDGVYHLSASATVGRDVNAGSTLLGLSGRLNGTQIGYTDVVALDADSDVFTIEMVSTIAQFTAGDEFTFNLARFTNGAGNAGLVFTPITLAGWADANSIRFTFSKLGINQ